MFRDRFYEVYFPDNWFPLLVSPSIILSERGRSLVPSVKVDGGTSQLRRVVGVNWLPDRCQVVSPHAESDRDCDLCGIQPVVS